MYSMPPYFMVKGLNDLAEENYDNNPKLQEKYPARAQTRVLYLVLTSKAAENMGRRNKALSLTFFSI